MCAPCPTRPSSACGPCVQDMPPSGFKSLGLKSPRGSLAPLPARRTTPVFEDQTTWAIGPLCLVPMRRRICAPLPRPMPTCTHMHV